MAAAGTSEFLAGVIEGFYGQPWTQAERFELFEWMAGWGLNTYLYAPKDDLKHRALWRKRYSSKEAEKLARLIRACERRNIHFTYALSPGLDIRYHQERELTSLERRFEQMLGLGCRNFALLFDDIPDRLDAAAIQRWGSLASAQCRLTNALFNWTRERCPAARFHFCPTPYCGRMAERKIGGDDYLGIVGRELTTEIDVFWTGPEIISREITAAHARELAAVLHRKPLIWDNLHANDYDGRRFFCGPYAGRPAELRGEVAGLLCNPNTEFPLNYVPLRTLAELVHGHGSGDPRQAYRTAMQEWLPRFATVGQGLTYEDLILFGDCYYLPHEEGPEAMELYECARGLLTTPPARWRPEKVSAFRQRAARLHELCIRMAELRDRPLFYALSRRIWDLREEMDLLLQWVAVQGDSGRPQAPSLTSHLPDTYRGGLVAKLQRLLVQQPDGSFTPSSAETTPLIHGGVGPAAGAP